MKLSRKMVLLLQVILIICIFTTTIKINTSANQVSNYDYRKIANVAVLLNKLDNPYINEFRQSLEDIENNNKDKIKYTFFDQKNNASIQNETLDLVTSSSFDLIVALLVDLSENSVKNAILKAKNKNIPLILININPTVIKKVSKYYDKVVFISVSTKYAGIVQGQIIADIWNSNKNIMDKNKDGILQYVLLKGGYMSEIADERTKYVIDSINNCGIKTQELQLIYCDWSRELAKNTIENVFLRYNTKIEAIISNNDDMAIGAMDGLQIYGYNIGSKSKYIPIFGVGGVAGAKELIDKGFLTGTVIDDPKGFANATYIIGMNLINNVNPLENTNFKLENNETKLPQNLKPYINNNIFK